ncbi:locomotion-related protein Hikaru genki isoform X1 [Macrobrachium rosenbergii]|uniref:locomotion-related protein Hikaru genki isoform X1 n=2 Tax=Macrobrachium rosenbergii TaxID=79674 RepID=UPI0034D3DE93
MALLGWSLPLIFLPGLMVIILSGNGCHGDKGCPPPTHSFNFSVLPVADSTDQVQEVMFMGVVGPFDEKRVCKIKCIDGRWVGPLCSLQQDSNRFQSMFRPCHVHNIPKHTIITYKQRQITPSPELEFPHGSVINGRCQQPGRYKLLGDAILTCTNASWKGKLPVCIQSNYFTNYSDSAPPALEWSIAGGRGMVDVAGSLVLLPGSILHLDCLYPRLHGNPNWAWTSAYRQYPTGWAINRQERELRYRLSLYYAKTDDSGVFTCTTPNGRDNYLHILVKEVSCAPVSSSELLKVEGDSVGLGDTISFSCPTGYYLNGPNKLTCLPSGEWSAPIPECLVIHCPVLTPSDPRLRLHSNNTTYLGSSVFSCLPGFMLEGPEVITCTANGTWSYPVPTCREVICEEVKAPAHGSVKYPLSRRVGDSVFFTCNPGYVLRGHSLAFCTQSGTWSHSSPTCLESCIHPGEPEHGHVSPRRPRYHVGATVLVTCKPGYRPAGPDRLTCLAIRRWSAPLTICVPSFG